ncbi:uncharacterized protein LOC100883445 isoform X3 [Megachile rotundata]|uniref:uncharacterized protein LOC100883445 isoform X3 n=1 Tax=Megachile rotundata TaxID=143995 RepID=UPI000258E4CF
MIEQLKNEEEKTKGSKIWNLFNATNYKSLMRHCIWLNVLVGILRCKMEQSRYVAPKSRFHLHVIFMVLFVVINILVCVYMINFSSALTEASMIIHSNFITILSPITILWCLYSNDSVVQMIQKVADVSDLLPPRTMRKLAKMIYIKDACQLIPYVLYILPVSTLWEIPFVGTITWYTFLTVITANALYVNNVYVLKACFERINNSLEKINSVLIKDEPHLLRRMYRSQTNPMLLSELRSLKKQHLAISSVVSLINETYGIQNIFALLLLFVDITFNVYHHIVFSFQSDITTTWFIGFNEYVIYHSFNIVVIIWTVEITKDEAQKIGYNIHRIVVNTFDEQMTTELQLFSLQALQSENAFQALGLPIDATIATKLICSITTNVLILIQFLLVKPC